MFYFNNLVKLLASILDHVDAGAWPASAFLPVSEPGEGYVKGCSHKKKITKTGELYELSIAA